MAATSPVLMFRGLPESTLTCTSSSFHDSVQQCVRLHSAAELKDSAVGTWLLRHSSVQNLFQNDSPNLEISLPEEFNQKDISRFLAVTIKETHCTYRHYLLVLFKNGF